jgi:hypothetical protein
MHFQARIQHAANRFRRRPGGNRQIAQRIRGPVEQIVIRSVLPIFHVRNP